jgi:hypothetical protein
LIRPAAPYDEAGLRTSTLYAGVCVVCGFVRSVIAVRALVARAVLVVRFVCFDTFDVAAVDVIRRRGTAIDGRGGLICFIRLVITMAVAAVAPPTMPLHARIVVFAAFIDATVGVFVHAFVALVDLAVCIIVGLIRERGGITHGLRRRRRTIATTRWREYERSDTENQTHNRIRLFQHSTQLL